MTDPRSKPHGTVNDRSSSSQPADDSRWLAHPVGEELGVVARDRRAVDLVDEVAESRSDLRTRQSEDPLPCRCEVRGQVRLAAERGAELVVVLRAHALEEVEPVRLPRRDAGDERGAEDTIRQQRGAGQRVRPAAGVPHDVRPFLPEVVQDGCGVRRDVGDAPLGQPG